MRHLEDSYVQEFDATVAEVRDGKFIVLDQTYFYATSGGQPADTGCITLKKDPRVKIMIMNVKKSDAGHLHEADVAMLDAGAADMGNSLEGVLAPGDAVHCAIDWPRRHRLMRSHTAAHIVSEIIHRRTGALITGNQLELDKVRIDFSLDAFDPDAFKADIDAANEVVVQGLAVRTELMPRAKAMEFPAVSKLAGGLPEHITEVRIVTIDGFDVQGCGGTHVKNTAEIGTLTFLKAENKGAKNRRVYFSLS